MKNNQNMFLYGNLPAFDSIVSIDFIYRFDH